MRRQRQQGCGIRVNIACVAMDQLPKGFLAAEPADIGERRVFRHFQSAHQDGTDDAGGGIGGCSCEDSQNIDM